MMNEGMPLPADASVGEVRLRVADLDRSLRFYNGLLSLRPEPDDGTTALSSPAGGRPILRLRTVPGSRERPEGVIGLYHFAILYPDRATLAQVIRRLIGAKWHFSGFADHGVSEAAYLQDPDGIGVELYADRPRAIWQTDARGRIVMYTRMPDLDDLLSEPEPAGEGRERMGHIHLHVTDLERSTAYHRDAVGFDITQDGFPGAMFLSAGGYHHHLGLNTWAKGRTTGPDAAGMDAWTLRVPDAAAAAALEDRLSANASPANGEHAFADPDGNIMIVESGAV